MHPDWCGDVGDGDVNDYGQGTLEVEIPQRSRYPRGRDTSEVEVP